MKNEDRYAVIETIFKIEEGVTTNLISIRNSREAALKDIERKKNEYFNYQKDYYSENEYFEAVDTDLDTVFDFLTEYEEYHLIACKAEGGY